MALLTLMGREHGPEGTAFCFQGKQHRQPFLGIPQQETAE